MEHYYTDLTEKAFTIFVGYVVHYLHDDEMNPIKKAGSVIGAQGKISLNMK